MRRIAVEVPETERGCHNCGNNCCENSDRCWETNGKYWKPRSVCLKATIKENDRDDIFLAFGCNVCGHIVHPNEQLACPHKVKGE